MSRSQRSRRWIDNLGADGAADYGEADHLLRDHLSGYWLDFVRTGGPDGAELSVWSTFADAPEQVMQLGVRGRAVRAEHT